MVKLNCLVLGTLPDAAFVIDIQQSLEMTMSELRSLIVATVASSTNSASPSTINPLSLRLFKVTTDNLSLFDLRLTPQALNPITLKDQVTEEDLKKIIVCVQWLNNPLAQMFQIFPELFQKNRSTAGGVTSSTLQLLISIDRVGAIQQISEGLPSYFSLNGTQPQYSNIPAPANAYQPQHYSIEKKDLKAGYNAGAAEPITGRLFNNDSFSKNSKVEAEKKAALVYPHQQQPQNQLDMKAYPALVQPHTPVTTTPVANMYHPRQADAQSVQTSNNQTPSATTTPTLVAPAPATPVLSSAQPDAYVLKDMNAKDINGVPKAALLPRQVPDENAVAVSKNTPFVKRNMKLVIIAGAVLCVLVIGAIVTAVVVTQQKKNVDGSNGVGPAANIVNGTTSLLSGELASSTSGGSRGSQTSSKPQGASTLSSSQRLSSAASSNPQSTSTDASMSSFSGDSATTSTAFTATSPSPDTSTPGPTPTTTTTTTAPPPPPFPTHQGPFDITQPFRVEYGDGGTTCIDLTGGSGRLSSCPTVSVTGTLNVFQKGSQYWNVVGTYACVGVAGTQTDVGGVQVDVLESTGCSMAGQGPAPQIINYNSNNKQIMVGYSCLGAVGSTVGVVSCAQAGQFILTNL